MAVAVRQRPSTRRARARPGHRLLRYDRALGVRFVAGTDEAGRGALAGPLVAAAVLFDYDRLQGRVCTPLGATRRLQDAHARPARGALRRGARLRLGRERDRRARARGRQARRPPGQPLRTGARAARRSTRRAVALLLSDGFRVPLEREHRAIIGGDGTSAAIAAASIVAKVTRDRLMRRLHAAYPAYGFDGHVGYSTPQHRDALRDHGPCPLHRRSFATVGALQLSLLAD